MTADSLPGYVLESTLGAGATGTVHLARKAEWANRLVAVKRVPHAATGTARALRHEAEVLAGLDHPHIVRILDLVRDGEGVAIAMQYAPGGSLAGLLAERCRLAPGEVVAVAAPLADALASAHRRGLLHCDVKPANVLFTSDGEPLLSDFGLARRVAVAGVDGHPAAGRPTGTAEYLDPAVVEGAAPDQRSDVYGLGAVCYELLAGHPPFTGPTPAAVLASALAGDPVPLALCAPAAPPELAAAVERALARQPADRWPDAASFAAALRAALPATPLRLQPAAVVADDRPGPSPAPAEVPAPVLAPAASVVSAAPRRPTRTFGPRPPRPLAAPVPSRRRPPAVRRPPLPVVAAGVVLVVVAVATALTPRRDRPSAVPPWPTTAPPAPARPVSWKGNVAEVDGTRYQMGQPGDLLLLGDWNCDGTATPALYRPSTGQVYRFDAWATAGLQLQAADGGRLPPHAVPTVAAGAGRCDRVVAAPAARTH